MAEGGYSINITRLQQYTNTVVSYHRPWWSILLFALPFRRAIEPIGSAEVAVTR
jgi:hypothetical protein